CSSLECSACVLSGLDAPLQEYPVSEWRLSGMDLLQITPQDLERLGVHKLGHQELLLDAVEKLCSLTYGLTGENLRGLTEKLQALTSTLQKCIQGRWRLNSYDGRSTIKLSVGILQLVVELIVSAKGLFSLLNRSDSTVYEKEKDIISVCRQLLSVCDDILKSSSDRLLSHAAELESVHLVPAAPGERLGIEITSTSSTNHYVTGTALEVSSSYLYFTNFKSLLKTCLFKQASVGWSRANLVKKLKEDPDGVTLVLKRIPGSKKQQNHKEEEENQRHSIFERVAASVRSLSFRAKNIRNVDVDVPIFMDLTVCTTYCISKYWKSITNKYSNSVCVTVLEQNLKLSRRRVSCRELGHPDCAGWLWKKRRDSGVFVAHKWQRFWFILKGPALYWYSSQDEKAEGFVNISSYNIESAGEHKRKYVFKVCHSRFQNFFFAADHVRDMSKWINCLITAIQKHKKLEIGPSSEEAGPVDEMGQMMNNIKEGGVSLTGQEQPFTHDHFRRSFIKRCKNPVVNEKVHTLRTLHSTLKAKEAELLQINKLLDNSDLGADTYRQWKQQNEELLMEIEKLAAQRDWTVKENTTTSFPSDAEGAFRLKLSDGEQLVDAEAEEQVELSQGSSPVATVTSPKLELDLGEAEHYFYI
uniref:Connector enhancer of kinase suppressor of Ras 1 n=1 Tax=Neogobius melanostomus TaxID=47308 RepID=A0A8C6WVN4_9GOBI